MKIITSSPQTKSLFDSSDFVHCAYIFDSNFQNDLLTYSIPFEFFFKKSLQTTCTLIISTFNETQKQPVMKYWRQGKLQLYARKNFDLQLTFSITASNYHTHQTINLPLPFAFCYLANNPSVLIFDYRLCNIPQFETHPKLFQCLVNLLKSENDNNKVFQTNNKKEAKNFLLSQLTPSTRQLFNNLLIFSSSQ